MVWQMLARTALLLAAAGSIPAAGAAASPGLHGKGWPGPGCAGRSRVLRSGPIAGQARRQDRTDLPAGRGQDSRRPGRSRDQAGAGHHAELGLALVQTAPGADLAVTAAGLAASADVERAEPNHILRPAESRAGAEAAFRLGGTLIPNDPYYASQAPYLGLMQMPPRGNTRPDGRRW